MNIGNRIQTVRKRVGITQAELAKRIGVSTITIRQYESNKRTPNIETLQHLADALNYPLIGLIGQENIPQVEDYFTPDLLPSEFNEFERFIETFGYYTRLEGDHYCIRHEDDSVEITPDELKRLVRSSRKTVAALLDAMMEEARG